MPAGPTEDPSVVFVVDDDDAVLRGLARLLRAAGYSTETFTSPTQFLARAPHDGPCCLVVDLSMPGMSGLEVQQALLRASVAMPIVFLSGQGTVPASVEALKAGALDFLTKPVEENVLVGAVELGLARSRALRSAATRRRELEARFARLTPREQQVADLVARGWLNKQVAYELGTSEKTVKVHRARALAKLGAGSVAELVRLVDERSRGSS